MSTKDPVYAERLDVLATFLESLETKRFNLHVWAQIEDEPSECGFVGCAMGWACQIPEFNAAGLSLPDGMIRMPHYAPAGSGRTFSGWQVAEQFFGLKDLEASTLFSPTAYQPGHRTPADVAERIRSLLNGDDVVDKYAPQFEEVF